MSIEIIAKQRKLNSQVICAQPLFFSIGQEHPGHLLVVFCTVDMLACSSICFLKTSSLCLCLSASSLFLCSASSLLTSSHLLLSASASCCALARANSASCLCLCLSSSAILSSSSLSSALLNPIGFCNISSYSSHVSRSCQATPCLKQDLNPHFRHRTIGCFCPVACS